MFKPEAYVDSVLDLLDDEQTLVAENIVKSPLDMQERYMSLVPDDLLEFIVKQWRPGMTSNQADQIFRKYSSFKQGGSVTTPKRGLVNEAGSYAGKNKYQIEQKENSLKTIAEIIQKADIEDNPEYLMRDKKSQIKRSGKVRYSKGMVSDSLALTLQGLQENQDELLKVANLLGEDPEYILDVIDESKYFADEARSKTALSGSRLIEKDNRAKFLKIEKWMTKNASKFDDPVEFKKSINQRFGNDNVLNIAVKNKRPPLFSDDFSMKILGAYSGDSSKLTTSLLDNVYSTVIYNFNTKVRDDITKEFTNILEGGPAKVKQEARARLRSSELLRKFNLDKKIEGPISNLIYKEIGESLYTNIQTFRSPRFRTTDLLQYLSTIVDPEYKTQFLEAKDAITAATNGNMKMAREKLKIADNIMYEHKIPQSIIDLGYADSIEYTKVVPTTENFNIKIKNPEFDKEINKLIRQYEKAPNPAVKTQLISKMNILKDKFSSKYGGYLDEVSIGLDKEGKLKFSSAADPVGKETDFLKELLKTQYQEKGKAPNLKQIEKKLATGSPFYKLMMLNCNKGKAKGGRIGYGEAGVVEGATCSIEEAAANLAKDIEKNKEQIKKGNFKNIKGGKRLLQAGGAFFGWVDAPIEFAFALPYLMVGDIQGAKRATTFGLLGAGGDVRDELNPEAKRYSKNTDLLNSWIDNYSANERLKKDLENEYMPEERFNMINKQITSNERDLENIQKEYDEVAYDTELDLEKGRQDLIKDLENQVKENLNIDLKFPLLTSPEEWAVGKQPGLDLEASEKRKVRDYPEIKDIRQYKNQMGQKYAGTEGFLFFKPGTFDKASQLGPDYKENLYGDYIMGRREGKELEDLYSSLPPEYTSQLSTLEKKDLLYGLKRKLIAGQTTKQQLEDQGFDIKQIMSARPYASGGLASLTRTIPPKKGPNSQGLAYLKKYVS